jgi:hypothetical protein
VIQDKTPDADNIDLVTGAYISRFEKRTLDDIRALGGNTVEDDRCFAAVARMSEANLKLYRTTLQPVIKWLANEKSAEWLRKTHPLRLGFEMFSDRNPVMLPIAAAAEKVKKNRHPLDSRNLFLQWEKSFSDFITHSLRAYGQWRDNMTENIFFSVYGQSWLQDLLGLKKSDGPPRKHPGEDPDHAALVKRRIKELRNKMDKGGPREAAIRALLYVRTAENAADERGFEVLRRIRAEHGGKTTLSQFKDEVRDQYLMLLVDEQRALETIPVVLKGSEGEAPTLLEFIRKVATAGGRLNEEGQRRLAQVEELFTPKP